MGAKCPRKREFWGSGSLGSLSPVLFWLTVGIPAGPFTSQGLSVLSRRGLGLQCRVPPASLLYHLCPPWSRACLKPHAANTPGDRPWPLSMGLDDLRAQALAERPSCIQKRNPETVTTCLFMTIKVQQARSWLLSFPHTQYPEQLFQYFKNP